ncbi:helix-turn-helix domain-containing protein [Streptomyces lomondensis]|uniref:DNA-binding protein n=1 Tax=Streptomyces lomondensis TaxID=68229 RepID=A0ABQ2XHP6_9ACTN|nr:helix-turn-helix domain-containing protein [Streptomyces lomondensis]MCF0077482.1 helix-turn-helix domain-containing protein [Streptomyces lomondensis]GGX17549.1 DNA-binding protein [Streptomyces lomondensis]
MDTQDTSVRPHAQSRNSGKNHPHRHTNGHAHPGGGVIHDNTRHTSRFTVIGNHLTQHPDLSLLAIGLACHIQSLPTGASVDIKSLAARFPEGPTRIAAALRELETHGYLHRTRERTPAGRIVTRTVSCNQPGRRRDRATSDGAPPRPPARRATTAAHQEPARRRALPAVPKPAYISPALLQTATEVLAGLRRADPRLLLSATDAEHLAPGVAAWLERDLTPTAVRHALTSDLPPEPLRRPAAFLAHRLTAQLPPLPPVRPPAPTAPEPRHPFQTCDGCDRPFRAPAPGRCRDCRSVLAGGRLA